MRRVRPDVRPRFALRVASERHERAVAERGKLTDEPTSIMHEAVHASLGVMRCTGCRWTGDAVQAVGHVMSAGRS
jgi:hypothetical protein